MMKEHRKMQRAKQNTCQGNSRGEGNIEKKKKKKKKGKKTEGIKVFFISEENG